jgi:hypothetical protein
MLVERRAWVRYASDLEASCRPTGAMKDSGWPAKVLNVSAGGLALLLRHRFRSETPLVIEVRRPADGEPYQLTVRVVHSRAVLADGSYGWLIGCEFAQPLNEDELHALLGDRREPV